MTTLKKSSKDVTSFASSPVIASNHSTSSSIMVQSPQQQHLQQRFSSNLCAVLNDPRKDRAKVSYLFTKTWGSDFVDSERSIPPITSVHPANFSNNHKKTDFKEYLESVTHVSFYFFESTTLSLLGFIVLCKLIWILECGNFHARANKSKIQPIILIKVENSIQII